MAFVDKTLEDMLREIHVTNTLRYDVIVPAMDPRCPKEFAPPVKYDHVPSPQEVGLGRRLWAIVSKHYNGDLRVMDRIRARRGENAVLAEASPDMSPIAMALENAFYHGNRENPELPVQFMAFEGETGIVASVKDSGAGFDFRNVIEKARAGFGKFEGKRRIYLFQPDERYFQRWGTCFWSFMIYPVDVSFEDSGSRVNMLFRDSERYDGARTLDSV
ncbi:MAG TPA: ATP-binding protein [Nanoarchaeota archaeon]|nr:ATP-binding protein [Nanoarchaeota archaeon]